MLTDVAGWQRPENYSTLQNADIDGDGQNELLGRDANGLHVWQLVRGAWIETSRLTALADSSVWKSPSHYSTIQFARLTEGSRQSDVIARGVDGMHVWHYDTKQQSWLERYPQEGRPFADGTANTSTTDWTQPSHYNSIIAVDLNGDGIDELVGRGTNGLEAYQWSSAQATWLPLALDGPLTDTDVAGESIPRTFQVIRSDRGNQLLSAGASGVQIFALRDGKLQVVSSGGPFGATGSNGAATVGSVRAYQDSKLQLWVYGLRFLDNSGSADLALYPWQPAGRRWGSPTLIPLPGTGWQRPSQYLSLRAGDFFGDGGLELLARSANGMHVFRKSSAGAGWRQTQLIRELSDSNGYGRASSFFTLQTLAITHTDAGPGSGATVLLGRGMRGVEVYHAIGNRLTTSTPFPEWANVNQSKAYIIISQALSPNGSSDIRSSYDATNADFDFWKGVDGRLQDSFKEPRSGIPAADWAAVYQQLDLEFQYVASARAWFTNNQNLSDAIFDQAATQLIAVQGYMTIQQSSGGAGEQIILNWAGLVAQITQQLAAVLGGPEAALVEGLLGDGIKAAALIDSGGNNQITAAVTDVATKLSQTQNQNTLQISQQLHSYVTDWGLLQQIGVGSTGPSPKYAWGSNSDNLEFNQAKIKGADGQEIWMFSQIAAAAWHVYWCFPEEWPFGGCLANSSYPSQYVGADYSDGQIHETAYVVIKAYRFPYPDFDALDLLTHHFNVNIFDIFTDCGGWTTDDPLPHSDSSWPQPTSCETTSSALSGDGLPSSIASLRSLRNRVRRNSPGPLSDSLTANIKHLQRIGHLQPAPYNGAPNAGDIQRASGSSLQRSVDKLYPLNLLDGFITAVDQASRSGLDPTLAETYKEDAFALEGRFNDDDKALSLVGQPQS